MWSIGHIDQHVNHLEMKFDWLATKQEYSRVEELKNNTLLLELFKHFTVSMDNNNFRNKIFDLVL